jgi:hypothetical protein
MRSGEENGERERFVQRLKELLCSLDGGGADPSERGGGVPSGFGWTETEEEYQRAQAAWLRGRRKRAERGRRGR